MCFSSFRGRANYTNLSRYSDLNERTYRRHFEQGIDFIEFNQIGMNTVLAKAGIKIAVMDCSFIRKSGDKTYGLGKFFDSKQGKAEKGLEISTLGVVDVDFNTAYHLSTRQTPPESQEGESRIHTYLRHFQEDCRALLENIRYLVVDAYYTKQTFVHGILAAGFHQIGKLRGDANLRYLYAGEQQAKGRPRVYDGKMVIGDLSRLEFVSEFDDIRLYTTVVNSVTLKLNIRIVYVLKTTAHGRGFALLFSTDTKLNATEIYRYYKARFQIEFLFRDAKQFTGLEDCQARSAQALHSHFNASLTALNLIKWHDRQIAGSRKPISVSNWKARFFNALFIERIFLNLPAELSLIKSSPAYDNLCHFGVNWS